jgi:hypothetical protein
MGIMRHVTVRKLEGKLTTEAGLDQAANGSRILLGLPRHLPIHSLVRTYLARTAHSPTARLVGFQLRRVAPVRLREPSGWEPVRTPQTLSRSFLVFARKVWLVYGARSGLVSRETSWAQW